MRVFGGGAGVRGNAARKTPKEIEVDCTYQTRYKSCRCDVKVTVSAHVNVLCP